MRIHWGAGIAIVYGVFMVLMVGFVIISRGSDHSLVMDNYYEEDLAYQSRITEMANAKSLATDLEIMEDMQRNNIRFQFPIDLEDIRGQIWFYRPDNTHLDVKMPIAIDEDNAMLVATDEMVHGKWRVKVNWASSGTAFYKEQVVNIP